MQYVTILYYEVHLWQSLESVCVIELKTSNLLSWWDQVAMVWQFIAKWPWISVLLHKPVGHYVVLFLKGKHLMKPFVKGF